MLSDKKGVMLVLKRFEEKLLDFECEGTKCKISCGLLG